jgi:NAD-dependent SIR2 family protein deacetylase
MFEQRNVVLDVSLLKKGDDYEAVYSIDLFCEKCSAKLDNAQLDKWLEIGFPLVLKCLRCGNHMVVNFGEIEDQIKPL